ncbi:hypothetical protein AK812_SmicGene2869 [Symbiodinium microadriaticum]|uniref:Uncharacterized protein n=1 Tax=Symbiodinium microadriaticum TaxID=2951 RepID=A0A1Q9F0I7_SYMMI|nr:hypothetical protein AK812_SmicGene2869 [Symbiodinium microadriaticum]
MFCWQVVAVGLHTTSTLEVVSALRDAVSEAWGRGGAGGAPFKVEFAGHPCPSHAGSEHHCAMRCELLGAVKSHVLTYPSGRVAEAERVTIS